MISPCYESNPRRENLTPSVGRVETKTANLDGKPPAKGEGGPPVDLLVKADVSSRLRNAPWETRFFPFAPLSRLEWQEWDVLCPPLFLLPFPPHLCPPHEEEDPRRNYGVLK